MYNSKFYKKKINILMIATICCALWGSAYPSIKIGYKLFNIGAYDTAEKFLFAGYRFTLAGIIVMLFQKLRKEKMITFDFKQNMSIVLLGVVQTTLQYVFFYIGLSNTSGVRGSIINGTNTFFCIILAHFLCNNDKLNRRKILGCILGFSGVVLVSLNKGSALSGHFTIDGDGFIMMSALCSAFGAVISKRIIKNIDPFTITALQLMYGGVVLILLGNVMGGHLSGFTVKSSMLLVYMALLSSVAFALWTQLIKYNRVGDISIYNFLVPVFGTLLSAFFLGENIMDIKILISLILVSVGIYIVNSKE